MLNMLLCVADDIYKMLRNVIADRYMFIDLVNIEKYISERKEFEKIFSGKIW